MRLVPLLTVALAVALAGCGRVAPTVMGAAPEVPKKLEASSLDDGMGVGFPASYAQTAPTPAPVTTGPQFDAMLVVSDVKKETSGILLWKKLKVTGKVTNKGNVALSGEVSIKFTKGGKAVETGRKAIAILNPGQSMGFELQSTVSADDVQTVTKAL